MIRKNKLSRFDENELLLEDGSREVQTVYGDVVTFVMMLFVLLFVLSYNDNNYESFFSQMSERFGGKYEQRQESVTTDAILVSQIQNYIKKEKLEGYAQILVDEQKVKLILSTPVLFESGKANMKPSGLKMIDDLGNLFKGIENPVIIEGHTDNVPIRTQRFQSNWQLSFERAFSVVNYLIHKKGYSPLQLSAQGFGEYQPLFDNNTAENRARNRRIEVNVVRITPTN